MEQQITQGSKILNSFLSFMVIALIGILLTVIVIMILWAIGIF